jgi:hypothetical protein
MLSTLKRWQMRTEDRLKYSTWARTLVSRYQRWRTPPANGNQQKLAASIVRLCAACRFATADRGVRSLENQILERTRALDPRQVDWNAFVRDLDDPAVPRSVILKPWLGPREKGVLFVSFEKEWFKLLVLADLESVSERYDLVVAPSGDPHNLLNCVFAAAYPGQFYSLISNAGDAAILAQVAPNVVVVPLYASSWVLPSFFEPRPQSARTIDLTMVANFAKFKRHYVLFDALRCMRHARRIRLIGQDQDGRTAATIRSEAECYGVAERIQIESNVPYERVAAALCESRASVILSRREGSCVAVAESMFADAPVAVLGDAELGSRAFINEMTGTFLDAGAIASQLDAVIENAESYSPRAWAEENISCHRSSRILNDLLRAKALAAGQEWTLDIAPLCWKPDPALVDSRQEALMLEDKLFFQGRFGLNVGGKR